jgi:vacuolar-type H+-ATPase subunit I/STV1
MPETEGMRAELVMINWKGALIGLFIFVVLWLVCFFIAFMIAFGNPSPGSRMILDGLNLFFTLANPLWGIPAALILGAVCIRKKD